MMMFRLLICTSLFLVIAFGAWVGKRTIDLNVVTVMIEPTASVNEESLVLANLDSEVPFVQKFIGADLVAEDNRGERVIAPHVRIVAEYNLSSNARILILRGHTQGFCELEPPIAVALMTDNSSEIVALHSLKRFDCDLERIEFTNTVEGTCLTLDLCAESENLQVRYERLEGLELKATIEREVAPSWSSIEIGLELDATIRDLPIPGVESE